MFKKIIGMLGVTSLVVGAISTVLGVDIAPGDVDKIVSALAVVALYYPKIHDAVVAKFSKE